MKKIKSILISQPQPESGRSPYDDLSEKMKLKVDFRQFIQVVGVEEIEFRQERIDLSEHTSVILTSKSAADHYFRIAKETRFTVPDITKYFCLNESIAYYLQKYVVYRKRKIFFGPGSFSGILEHITKHKTEKFLLPVSNISNDEIPDILTKEGISFSKAVLYKTVPSDLSDLANVNYDMLVFFSPSGIESLFMNFPDFKQNDTKIAVWGKTTAKAASDAGLRIDIEAPIPDIPSMTKAIEVYIQK